MMKKLLLRASQWAIGVLATAMLVTGSLLIAMGSASAFVESHSRLWLGIIIALGILIAVEAMLRLSEELREEA